MNAFNKKLQHNDYNGAIGSQFVDSRENELKDQVGGPPTNPIEMAMTDKASVVERLQEKADYVTSLEALFDDAIFDNTEDAYAAMVEAIGEFEKTEQFSTFDSEYDRFLKGEYTYDPLSKAAASKALFFSQKFANCATCHQVPPTVVNRKPLQALNTIISVCL